jgi:hypothetical protein
MNAFKIFSKLSFVAAITLRGALGFGQTNSTPPVTQPNFPSWTQVKNLAEAHFAARGDFRRNDLITGGDVTPIFHELEGLGWKNVSRSEVAKRLLDDNDFLARELRSPPGRTFMRRVAGYTLIYDRLDRISRMPGGHALIHDMIRLPDGHRYAQFRPARGVPPMSDFLPKGASGKAPQAPDLEKPTGRIYTFGELLTHLEATHREAQKAVTNR